MFHDLSSCICMEIDRVCVVGKLHGLLQLNSCNIFNMFKYKDKTDETDDPSAEENNGEKCSKPSGEYNTIKINDYTLFI